MTKEKNDLYRTDKPNFPVVLPVAKQMINSFVVTKANRIVNESVSLVPNGLTYSSFTATGILILFFLSGYISDNPAQSATHPPDIMTQVVITTFPAKGFNEIDISDPKSKTTEWLLYEDKDLGFSIEYPEDWTKKTDGLPGYTVVNFYAPKDGVAVQVMRCLLVRD